MKYKFWVFIFLFDFIQYAFSISLPFHRTYSQQQDRFYKKIHNLPSLSTQFKYAFDLENFIAKCKNLSNCSNPKIVYKYKLSQT